MIICLPVVVMMIIGGVDVDVYVDIDVDVGVDDDYLSTSDVDGEGGGDDYGGVDVDYLSTSSVAPSFIAFKSHSKFNLIQPQDLQ